MIDRAPGASPMRLRGVNDNRDRRHRALELTIEEMLAEPMVRELMRADDVDPRTFEALLRSITPAAAAPRSAPR